MADLLENIFGTMFSPASTFRRMLEERTSVTIAAIIVLIAAICSGVGSILTQSAVMSMFSIGFCHASKHIPSPNWLNHRFFWQFCWSFHIYGSGRHFSDLDFDTGCSRN